MSNTVKSNTVNLVTRLILSIEFLTNSPIDTMLKVHDLFEHAYLKKCIIQSLLGTLFCYGRFF